MSGNIASILLAALGISFLIFIHELGHFLAARAFKVRVETFSLGFGPRIWGFRRGETDYRLSLVPLGGYVKMAGEYGDLRDSSVLAADDLAAKPAWQRAIIFAGGVIMNVLFAFLVFPAAFALGVPFTAPVIGSVDPGGPAWRAGLLPGDEVLAVDGHRVYQFADIALDVALGDPERTDLHLRRGGVECDLVAHPERSPSDDHRTLGIGPVAEPRLAIERDGPAALAGLQPDDELVAIDGEPLCADTAPDLALERAFDAGRPVHVTVRRGGGSVEATIVPQRKVDPSQQLLGVTRTDTTVIALRCAALRDDFPLKPGDTLLEVAGLPVSRSEQVAEASRGKTRGDLVLRVHREGRDVDVTLAGADRDALRDNVALGVDPGTRIRVLAESALAAAGVRDGDTIVALNGTVVHDYADLHARTKAEGPRFHVDYRNVAGALRSVDVETRPVVTWNYGVQATVREVRRQENLGGALRAGWDTSRNMLRTTWLQLEKVLTGDVAAKSLGGIVSISYLTYQFASAGFTRLLFFLGLLSINLAFINVLPVPVLDGGQLLFLLIEKVKGGRLSERFLNAAQLAGLLAILALVVYVTYNDISRFVG